MFSVFFSEEKCEFQGTSALIRGRIKPASDYKGKCGKAHPVCPATIFSVLISVLEYVTGFLCDL